MFECFVNFNQNIERKMIVTKNRNHNYQQNGSGT